MAKGKRQRVKYRGFELIYNCKKDLDQKRFMKRLCSKKYGVYKAFSVVHHYPEESEDEKTHIHVGLVLRDDKINDFYYDQLTEYFTVDTLIPYQRGPLKDKSKSFEKKLQTYYDYCIDKTQHPDPQQILGPHLYKFLPKDPKVIAEEDMSDKVYFLVQIKLGKTFREILENAPIKREASFYMDMNKYKKMYNNYKKFNRDDTVHHDIKEFKPSVVEAIKKDWNPKKQTLILKGPSNMGKTELSKSLLKEVTGDCPKMLSNINQLNYRDPHQPMILDDMNFSKISRSKLIALLDIENTRGIRVLYDVHEVEAGTARIMTTNEELFQLFSSHDEACTRRFHCVDLTKYGKLYEENKEQGEE